MKTILISIMLIIFSMQISAQSKTFQSMAECEDYVRNSAVKSNPLETKEDKTCFLRGHIFVNGRGDRVKEKDQYQQYDYGKDTLYNFDFPAFRDLVNKTIFLKRRAEEEVYRCMRCDRFYIIRELRTDTMVVWRRKK